MTGGNDHDDYDYTTDDIHTFDLQDTRSDHPRPLRFRQPRYDYHPRKRDRPLVPAVPWPWFVLMVLGLAASGFLLGLAVAWPR